MTTHDAGRQIGQVPSESWTARDGRPTRAAGVAEAIIDDVLRHGSTEWPDGRVLGSEAELLDRYGVSRSVLREAIRLIEHQQVARMRRGPGGGLTVTTPTMESVIDAVAVYLFYANTRVDQVTEARLALEGTVAELAPQRLTEGDIVELRSLARREQDGTANDHRELHALLASITRNPALEVFVGLTTRLTFLYFPDIRRVSRATIDAAAHAHLGIIDAVVAGNVGSAQHRMRAHLEAEAAVLRKGGAAGQLLDPGVLRSLDVKDKRGEQVARELFVEIVAAGWPVGTVVGSQSELMARFAISRAVLREAVRLLEHHDIASMRRGPGGGLVVAQPGVQSAATAIALLLESRHIHPRDLFEVRTALEMAVVDLVVKRLDADGVTRLHEALERERRADLAALPEVGHDVHAVLASMVGNPVFELLTLVLIRLTRLHQDRSADPTSAMSDEVHRAHHAVVEAVVERDAALARHRMRRHLDVLATWMR